MKRLLDTLDRVSLWGAYAAAVLILLMLALILSEVIARKIFGISIEWAWEFACYLLGISFLAGSSYALRIGFHVRVQIAMNALGPKHAPKLDFVVTLFATVVAAYFAYSLGLLAWKSYVDDTRSFLPSNALLWPFQTLFALGGVLLALQFAARTIRIAIGEPADLVLDDAPLIKAE